LASAKERDKLVGMLCCAAAKPEQQAQQSVHKVTQEDDNDSRIATAQVENSTSNKGSSLKIYCNKE
jgi:hypothetical protein